MMTVNEVSKLTGVSIRTLQYYDTIGLLKPDGYTASGYRLYDDTALERLQQILLFKELEFPLKEIKPSRCSFFIVNKSICWDSALSRSKSGASMILLISFNGNSSSLNNGDRLQNTRNMKKRQKISLPRHKKQHGKILCSFL